MLQTQVNYWANREQARHNRVSEQQNLIDLERRRAELDETIAQNTRQVAYWQGQLNELTRHNKATEKLTSKELAIKREQAKASLQQAQASLSQAETARMKLPYDTAEKSASAELKGAQSARAKKEDKWYLPERIGLPLVTSAIRLLGK